MNPQKSFFFTAGPAQLYPNFELMVQKALAQNIGSISHRSKTFKTLYQKLTENLRALLALPPEVAVFFTGSATEVWERTLQNLTRSYSLHLVNGAFSKKYYDFAVQLRKKPQKYEVELGQGFSNLTKNLIDIPDEIELLCLTHNETSTGAMMPTHLIHSFKQHYPQILVSVDIVSSAPYPALDFNYIDTAFFSVQKGFGLPAGLGIWLVHERCLSKAEALQALQSIGTYHGLPTLWKSYRHFETPETPNVWAIFLLNEVVEAMLEKGINNIRCETEEKAQALYHFAQKHPRYQPFVKQEQDQSATVVVLQTGEVPSSQIIQYLAKEGFVIGGGYGDLKEQQIRIANFPAISPEHTYQLIALLEKYDI